MTQAYQYSSFATETPASFACRPPRNQIVDAKLQWKWIALRCFLRPGRFLIFTELQNFLVMTHSVNVSKRQHICYHYPTEPVRHLLIPMPLAMQCHPNCRQQHLRYFFCPHPLQSNCLVLVEQRQKLSHTHITSINATHLLPSNIHKLHCSLNHASNTHYNNALRSRSLRLTFQQSHYH